MLLQKKLQRVIPDILQKQMNIQGEKKILIYDKKSRLSLLLANAYRRQMPEAEHVDFDTCDKKILREKLLSLPAGSTVILVQSKNFRLDAFRIRLQLFNNSVGCLEHTHLQYIDESEYETYIDALEYRGGYYEKLGAFLSEKLENCQTLEIFSRDNSLLTFGKMEKGFLNHGHFWKQKNRGGGAICGEIFSEAKDFSSVNGEMLIKCYPGNDLRIIQCDPFRIQVTKSKITCDDPKCPSDFRENILERISKEEDEEVMMREAGFGLNPAISFKNPLSDVNAFERMSGFHISLGKKHQMYRQKMPKNIVQRYHVDIFADLKKICFDGRVVFIKGKYVDF